MAEVSVDTRVTQRKDTSRYQLERQDGLELYVSSELAKHTRQLNIELKKFLFLRHLKATAQLKNGLVLGHPG